MGGSLCSGRLVPTPAAPLLLKQGYCEGCDVNPCVNQTRCSLCLKGGGQSLEFKCDSLSLPEFLIIYLVTPGGGGSYVLVCLAQEVSHRHFVETQKMSKFR